MVSRAPQLPSLVQIQVATQLHQLHKLMLSLVTFGLLGFSTMKAKPEGKCACGTYPLYLTEKEAGGPMCHRMLKVASCLAVPQRHRPTVSTRSSLLPFRSGPDLRRAVRCSLYGPIG